MILLRGGCPIRTFLDQNLLAVPQDFSQRATSFIASWCQGIHRMPFCRSINLVTTIMRLNSHNRLPTMHRNHPSHTARNSELRKPCRQLHHLLQTIQNRPRRSKPSHLQPHTSEHSNRQQFWRPHLHVNNQGQTTHCRQTGPIFRIAPRTTLKPVRVSRRTKTYSP
jgi:hypothetical protein